MTIKASKELVDHIIWAYITLTSKHPNPNVTPQDIWRQIADYGDWRLSREARDRLISLSDERSQIISDVIDRGEVPGLELAIGIWAQIIVRRSLPEALDDANSGADTG